MENFLYLLGGLLAALGIWFLANPRNRTIKSFWDMVRNPDLMPDFDAIEKDIKDRADAISGSPSKVANLVDRFLFEVESADKGWAIKRVLNELGEQVNPRLVEVLKDPSLREELVTFTKVNDWSSESPLERLCQLFDSDKALPPEAIPPLGAFLGSQDIEVRKCAAFKLGQDATPQSLPYVLQALGDEDDEVRGEVLNGLPFATGKGRISSEIASPLFEAIVKLWEAAGSFRSNDNIPEILLSLDRERAVEKMLKDEALNSGPQNAKPILEAFNKESLLVPRAQLFSLIEVASKDVGTYPNKYVVCEGLANLGAHRHPDDMPLLERHLEHPDETVCEGAVRGLYAYHRFFETIRNPHDVEEATGWASLTTAEKHILALETLDAEVRNGGFSQYYFNSSGERWEDARDGLRAIGSVERLRLMEETLIDFPNGAPSIKRSIRNDQLAMIARRQKHPFEEQDDRWYKSQENLDLLIFRYNLANCEGREK